MWEVCDIKFCRFREWRFGRRECPVLMPLCSYRADSGADSFIVARMQYPRGMADVVSSQVERLSGVSPVVFLILSTSYHRHTDNATAPKPNNDAPFLILSRQT